MSNECNTFYSSQLCIFNFREFVYFVVLKKIHLTVTGGQPYSELLRSRILEPLNMTSTRLTSEVPDFSKIPTPYIWSERDQELLEINKNAM